MQLMTEIPVAEALICPLTKLFPNTNRELIELTREDFLIIINENPWISQVCDQDHKTSSTEECSWVFAHAKEMNSGKGR